MPTWKLTIEYEGTRYYGWQEQKSAKTVAGEIRNAAESFLGRPVELVGAGRTDAGVHALAQVARLRADKRVSPLELSRALNQKLPPDINVLSVDEAQQKFDPIHSAVARYYLYQISTRRTAFAKRFVWWVKDRLDFEAMRKASSALVGTHDFARFADKRVEDRSTSVAVITVEMGAEGDLLLFRIGATHFLWKMVRRIVGSLVEVGRGHLEAEQLKGLIVNSDRPSTFNVAEHTAPPSGLFLERVVYDSSENPPPLKPAFPVSRLDRLHR